MDVATIATPNLPELRRLTERGRPVAGALNSCRKHRCAVLIKGGHEEGDALADALIETDNITSWQGQRIDTTRPTAPAARWPAPSPFPGRALACRRRRPAREFVRVALHARRGLAQGRADRAGAMCASTSAARSAAPQPGDGDLSTITPSRSHSTAHFGLKQIVDSPENAYARFETGGGATISIQADPEEIVSATTAIYLECDDIDAEVDRLARLGVPFEHGPRNQPWMWREARLRDPSGNTIFLYKAGEARRIPPWRMD
jgi:hydroxymethylpyrimidine/phosphomethylpyrimidine kinase